MRDAAPTGAVASALKQTMDWSTQEIVYTNKPLADLAYIYTAALIDQTEPDYERTYWGGLGGNIQADTLDVDSEIPPDVEIKL